MEPTNPYAPSEPANPYAPPMADVNLVAGGAPSDAEAIRREHIKHEASLRSFGGLYLFGGVGMLLLALSFVAMATGGNEEPAVGWVATGVSLALAAAYSWVGAGLRRLDRRVRLGASLLAAISLLSFPIGTLLGGYLLYLIHGAKGQIVFGEAYPGIVAATRHIKRPTSLLTWGLLGAFILLGILLVILTVKDATQVLQY